MRVHKHSGPRGQKKNLEILPCHYVGTADARSRDHSKYSPGTRTCRRGQPTWMLLSAGAQLLMMTICTGICFPTSLLSRISSVRVLPHTKTIIGHLSTEAPIQFYSLELSHPYHPYITLYYMYIYIIFDICTKSTRKAAKPALTDRVEKQLSGLVLVSSALPFWRTI